MTGRKTLESSRVRKGWFYRKEGSLNYSVQTGREGLCKCKVWCIKYVHTLKSVFGAREGSVELHILFSLIPF